MSTRRDSASKPTETIVTFFYVAKCKLGKVKIEPMLVGFCLTEVSGLPPKRMMPGGCKGLAPPLHRHGTLPVHEGIFADSSQSEWINLPPSDISSSINEGLSVNGFTWYCLKSVLTLQPLSYASVCLSF